MTRLPRVGVSACLLGRAVRWDGGHKRDDGVLELSRLVEYVPVCPEDEVGMGTPREPIKLNPQRRLVGARSGTDHTDAMTSWAAQRLRELDDIDGYVLKADSPSCGLKHVRVQGKGSIGRGTFAQALTDTLPLLPVTQEADVGSPFAERVYAHMRWRTRSGSLHEFHARHKYQLLAHSQRHYRELGRLVAEGGDPDSYAAGFFAALALPATRAKHANVLHHLHGFVKRHLDDADRAELTGAIADYGAGRTSLDGPLALLTHHLRRNPNAWAQAQTYLDPLRP